MVLIEKTYLKILKQLKHFIKVFSEKCPEYQIQSEYIEPRYNIRLLHNECGK